MVLEAHFINPMDSKKVKRMKVFKKIKPVISLESRITQLQLAYFGHTIRRHQSLEKGIMLGPNRANKETRRTSNPMADTISLTTTRHWPSSINLHKIDLLTDHYPTTHIPNGLGPNAASSRHCWPSVACELHVPIQPELGHVWQ